MGRRAGPPAPGRGALAPWSRRVLGCDPNSSRAGPLRYLYTAFHRPLYRRIGPNCSLPPLLPAREVHAARWRVREELPPHSRLGQWEGRCARGHVASPRCVPKRNFPVGTLVGTPKWCLLQTVFNKVPTFPQFPPVSRANAPDSLSRPLLGPEILVGTVGTLLLNPINKGEEGFPPGFPPGFPRSHRR
jgi:hypothetical protein